MTYTNVRRPARENYWQDWANAIVAVWFFISPWVLQFGAGATPVDGAAAGVLGAAQAAAWNAWIVSVIVFLVAVSAISRMDFWQEYVNIVLSIWIFVAPWILGFMMLQEASWNHWIVGVLIFLFSVSVLARARRARTVAATPPTDTPASRPPGTA